MRLRSLILATFLISGWGKLHPQDADPAIEIGAAYGRAVTEKEKLYLVSMDNLTKKYGKLKTHSPESIEASIVAMKKVVSDLINEGKEVVGAFEKYKTDSKEYVAALDRMPSAIRSMADAARIKAQKNANNPMGRQYEMLAKNYTDLANDLPLKKRDVEAADSVIAQAVSETERAVEFLIDYNKFLDVLALGDIAAARQAFREKLHQFMRNYQRFDTQMQQFHERLKSTSSSDEVRNEYQLEQKRKIDEHQERERQKYQALENERQNRIAAMESERQRQAWDAQLAASRAEAERKQREAEYRKQYNANRAAIAKLNADARKGVVVGYAPSIPPPISNVNSGWIPVSSYR